MKHEDIESTEAHQGAAAQRSRDAKEVVGQHLVRSEDHGLVEL